MKRRLLLIILVAVVAFALVSSPMAQWARAQDETMTPGSALPEESFSTPEPGRASVRVDATLEHQAEGQRFLPGVAERELSSSGAPEMSSNQVRWVPQKPAHTEITPYVIPNLIVVKFVEGSGVRLRQGRLTSFEAADLSGLDEVAAIAPQGKWHRLFTRPEVDLARDKERGEARTGWQLADLNLYFRFELPPDTPDPAAVIDSLNALDIVEIAYPEPIPQEAQVLEDPGPVGDIPPTTPNFTNQQGYLNAAPQGLDARYSWQFDGGAGLGIDIIDVEQGWDVCHEDLDVLAGDVLAGTNSGSDHGTAVLGEMIGFNNNYGVTGIAHQANVRMVSYIGIDSYPDVHNALNTAAANLNAGDIYLIEIHAYAVDSGLDCHCNCGQFEYVAMEYFQANFDAIQTATANGIIVVEAAGNGSMNLDSSIYNNRFNRNVRDSGAIVVGAATSGVPHEGTCWTNYGSRVDVYGWGYDVVTTGYGNAAGADGLFDTGTDDCQDYRDGFSGTSSASPMIVGAAADIQGILLARGDDLLTPLEMRAILANNGTPHGTNPEDSPRGIPIGVLPDLRQAIPAALGNNGNVLFFLSSSSNEAEANRIRSLGYKVTTTTNVADLTRTNLQNYDVLYVGWGAAPATYSAYNSHIRNWVYYDGGGVIVEQPNTVGAVTLFPTGGYEVSVSDVMWPNGYDAVISNGQHPITRGLSDADLAGNFDTVYDTDVGYKWWILARDASTSEAVALTASYYGSGRFVFQTHNISPSAFDPGSDLYVQRLLDWAANLGPQIALVETGASVSNSVIRALNELDRKFDFFYTSDFSTINFSSYDAVIVAMDGGFIEESSIQNIANYANGGGNLIMIGGSSLPSFANAVDSHLLDIDTANYGWKTVTATPHLDVVNSNHPLTDGLPDTYNFNTTGATYYMIRSQDTVARIMARNGDNQPALIQKPLGSGNLNWFINAPSTYYWGDAGDYNILKTIIRNMLAQGVIGIYHSPYSMPRGLGWTYYPNLYNCDDNDSIYHLQSYSFALLNTFPIPGGGLGLGLAYDGSFMWHADMYAGGTGTIYKLNPGTMAVVDSFPSPRPNPADLAYGGGYLWAAILQAGPIIKIDPDTGAEVDYVDVPTGSRPFGLTWADGYLYVGDTNNDVIYKINPDTGVVASTFPSPGPYPSGLTFDGDYFWVADWTDHAIYKTSLQSEAADVRVTSITFDPASPVAGEDITVSVTVYNAGPVAAPGFYVEFWRNIDHRPDVYEFSTDWWYLSLAAGASTTLTKTINYASPGTYYTGAFADSANWVDEGIYGDNNSLWPINLTVAPCPDPPVIEDISFDGCISELCTTGISVVATDPCGGNLTYTWSASGGSIAGSGREVIFDPPNSGPHQCPYQIQVEVTSDASGLSATGNIGIHVKLAGDVNGSGNVNVLDKVLVRNAFGTSGPPGWIDADVDCNGTVNVLDKVIVRNDFGQTGCVCSPSPCFGQSCGFYTKDCDPDVPCGCFQTTEGYGNCSDDFLCGGAQLCNSSADCPSGQLCYTETCCGQDVCGPAACTDGGPAGEPFGGETASGE